MKKLLSFFLLLCFGSQLSSQCTFTAKCSGGEWSAASTWTIASGCPVSPVPTNNCYIVIPACATVLLDLNSTSCSNIQLDVYGTLDFGKGKINLAPGVVNVHEGGKLIAGAAASKISYYGEAVWSGRTDLAGPASFGGTSLPVQLTSFEASSCGNSVCISWTTASEKENDHFSLERSFNGEDFEIAGILAGANNSSTLLTYTFSDNTPYEGVSYYRLKQTDHNGDHSYSPVIRVEHIPEKEIDLTIFPNPNDGENINLKMNSEDGEEVLVVVYDASGREAYSKVLITEESESVYVIDPAGKLPPGLYVVTASSRQSIYRKRLVVK